MNPDQTHQEQRIEKLELASGYTEHHIEVLSGEIAQLNKTVATLSRRLGLLESRLTEINDKVGEAPPMVPPPHSAGPDVPREPL